MLGKTQSNDIQVVIEVAVHLDSVVESSVMLWSFKFRTGVGPTHFYAECGS